MTSQKENPTWRDTLLPTSATMQQAIQSLENSNMQIVLAVSEKNKLEGTLTDGDIRRAFLRGLQLDSRIDEIINRNPFVAPCNLRNESVLEIMKVNGIYQLPILDDDGLVVGLHVWRSILKPTSLENMMIIIAGGRGERLQPFTQTCPKPMLRIGEKPMLEHIIERARNEGFQNFIIAIHYLGEIIQNHFKDGSKFGVRINYIREESPLGTAGCLSLISKIPDLPFVVTNGDVLTDIRYRELIDFHTSHNASGTMAVRRHEIQNQFGVVQTRGVDIEKFEEKPVYRNLINAGIYALNPDTLSLLQCRQHCDMPTLFQRLKTNSRRTIVYPLHESWLDVGCPEDLKKARDGTK